MFDNVNDDMTKAEIVAFIKEAKSDLPALGELNTSVNKTDLIESVNEILNSTADDFTDLSSLGDGNIEDMPVIQDNSFGSLDFEETAEEPETTQPETPVEPETEPEAPVEQPVDPKPADAAEEAYVRKSGNSSTFGRVRR